MELKAMSDDELSRINAEMRREFNEGELCMVLSEPVLASEWLTPEEDEAWRFLNSDG